MTHLRLPFVLSLLCACATTSPDRAAAFASAPGAAPATAPSREDVRSIRVAGRAELRVTPDVAIVSLGVVDSARTADKAVSANNRHMDAITGVVRKLGVAKADDIQTSNFSVFEDFGIGGRVKGFTASNTLTVEIHDLDRTGEILDAAVRAGANSVMGVSFEVDDRSKAERRALELAMTDAASRGKVLARTAGGKLGKVVTIDTVVSPRFEPRFLGALESGSDVPIEPGTITSEVEIAVTFELL